MAVVTDSAARDRDDLMGIGGDEVDPRSLKAKVRLLFWRVSSKIRLRTPIISGYAADRLAIHPTARVNNALINLQSGTVEVGAFAFFGHDVALLTGTHDITTFGAERRDVYPRVGRDIVIEEGAWLASRVTVIGPCTIGAHAVVAAGALVTKDVAPFSIVAGAPARVVGQVPPDDSFSS